MIPDMPAAEATDRQMDSTMNPKQLLLHVGLPKTGTTAFQHYLIHHRDALEAAGTLVPATAIEAGNYLGYCLLDRIPPLIHNRLDLSSDEVYSRICREIVNSPQPRALISCEMLSLISSDLFEEGRGLARLFELLAPHSFDIRIIIYLRRQDEFLESWYNQTVKTHQFYRLYTGSIEEFAAEQMPLLDYASLLARWESFVGRSRLQVCEYRGQNLVSELIQSLHLCPAVSGAESSEEQRKNLSLSSFGVELMRHLNKYPVDKSTPAATALLCDVICRLEQQLQIRSSHALLTEDQRRSVLESCRDSNQQIRSEYGIDTERWLNQVSGEEPEVHHVTADITATLAVELFNMLAESDRSDDSRLHFSGRERDAGNRKNLIQRLIRRIGLSSPES